MVGKFGLHTACCAFNGPGIRFPGSLRAGCTQDRGKERKGSAAAVLRAMFFAAFKLSLPVMSTLLESPLIQAWKDLGKGSMATVRKVISLPLDLVRKLEPGFSGSFWELLC